MNIYIMAFAAVLIMVLLVGSVWAAASRIDGGAGHNPFEGTPARIMDALEAELGDNPSLRRPDEGFWHAFEHKHPHLQAALDFDEQLPAAGQAGYDTFWTALRDQDSAFWASLQNGDNQPWARLEHEHGVHIPVLAAAGGRS